MVISESKQLEESYKKYLYGSKCRTRARTRARAGAGVMSDETKRMIAEGVLPYISQENELANMLAVSLCKEVNASLRGKYHAQIT